MMTCNAYKLMYSNHSECNKLLRIIATMKNCQADGGKPKITQKNTVETYALTKIDYQVHSSFLPSSLNLEEEKIP